MKTIHKIKIDLLTPGLRSRVYVVQDDICTREVQISLYSGGASWSPAKASAAVGYSKTDGTTGLYDSLPDGSAAISISGNVVTVILAAQMLTCAGTVEAAVTLADANGNQISTFAFDVIVSANPGSDAIKSEDYFNYVNPKIQAVIEQAAAATTAANTAASRANASAELAEDAYDLADTANQKVDTLREVVSKFHNNIVETASGDVIILNDASDLELAGLRIFGKTEQRTTTGKNLLKNTATTQTVNGVEFTVNHDGSVTANGEATGTITFPLSSGNVFTAGTYVLSGCPSGGNATNKYSLRWNGSAKIYDDIGAGVTITVDSTETTQFYILIRTGVTVSNLTFYPMLRLASITETAYEPYTGGIPSPNPEYPQALKSVGDDGSVTTTVCGKNLLDESKLLTSSGTGRYTENVDEKIHFVNTDGLGFTPSITLTLPPGTYYFGASIEIIIGTPYYGYYINDGPSVWGANRFLTLTEISQVTFKLTTAGTKEAGEYYANFWLTAGDTVTTYVPYTGTTATVTPVDSSGNSLHLPGIPVTSGGNYTDPVTKQQWICDEVDFEKGVYVQRVKKVVLTGEEVWTLSSLNAPYATSVDDIADCTDSDIRLLCDRYPAVNIADSWSKYDYLISRAAGNSKDLQFRNVNISTLEEWKAHLDENPITVQYILAEENRIPLSEIDPDALAQYATLHTNYPNTTIFNDAGANMEVKYVTDTKLYVDKKFEELAKILINKL